MPRRAGCWNSTAPCSARRFIDIAAPPCPLAAARGFSAPVADWTPLTPADPAFLLRHETDGYNRWTQRENRLAPGLPRALGDQPAGAAGETRCRRSTRCSTMMPRWTPLLAELLTPPDALELAELINRWTHWLHAARESLEQALAARLGLRLAQRHGQLLAQECGALDGAAQARRRLLERCLLSGAHRSGALDTSEAAGWRTSMSERLGAPPLARHAAPQAETALAAFPRARYADDAITLDKWFAPATLHTARGDGRGVAALRRHPRFVLANPNCGEARRLRSFAARNRWFSTGQQRGPPVSAPADRVNWTR